MIKETWKEIKDYEGYYQCSSKGVVRSVDRRIDYMNSHRDIKGHTMALHFDHNGAPLVTLNKQGIRKNKRVYKLVSSMFGDVAADAFLTNQI